MEAAPLHNPEHTPYCEFGYDAQKHEASVRTPDGKSYVLINTTLTEPNETYSIISGIDALSDEAVVIEILEDQGKLEVVKVTVDGIIMYEPTKH